MALANNGDLQSAVQSWMNRNESGFTAMIPDFIALAEAELNSRVRVRQNMTTAALTLVAWNDYVALPTDFLEDVELNYTISAQLLLKASYNDIDRIRGEAVAGQPSLYAINGTNINFERDADASYALTLRYYEAWAIATDSTNWLLTTHPDAYLFGALAEAHGWLGDANAAQWARGKMEAAIQRALTADSRTRGAPLRVDAALLRRSSYNILTD